MDTFEAKSYLRERIINKAFVKDEVGLLDEFTQRNMNWVMNFKSLSMDKLFLEAFVVLFDETFKEFNRVQVCGMESGALPFVTAIRLHSKICISAFYIRKSAKKSDLAKMVEGEILKDVPIIIIDDLINDGNTVKKQLTVLESLGFESSDLFSLLRFRENKDYESVFGKIFKVKSVFDLNDFTSELGVINKNNQTSHLPNFYAWEGLWKIKLSKHNPFIVVPKSAPVADEKYVYIGSDDGGMRAISKLDGKVIWEMKIPFGGGGKRIFSSPALYKDNIFFGGYDGTFYCLDAVTGKRRWLFMDADWIGSSPVVSPIGDAVYIGLEFGLFKKRGGVAAVDIKTGKLLWGYYDMTGLTHASPAISLKLNVVICGCNDNFIYCFDRKKGDLLWKFETQGEVKYAAVFDEKRKLVIIGSMDGGIYCIHTETGELYHLFETRGAFYSNPILFEDKVIIGNLDKKIYCFNLSKKKEVWAIETKGRVFASPVKHKESIFIGTNEGAVYELNVHTGKVISLIQLTERVVNKIIIEEEKGKRVLFVPTHACELYKFEENKLT